jgi:hypothetical protein
MIKTTLHTLKGKQYIGTVDKPHGVNLKKVKANRKKRKNH